MSHPFLSKRKDDFYGHILRVSRVTKERLRSGTKRGEKGGFIDHFYATYQRFGCESWSFPDVSRAFPFRGTLLGKSQFAFRTNTEKSAKIVQIMYDVIRKSYCCAKSRLSRNFSYISRQGILPVVIVHVLSI